jgi:hypothetical protein
MTRGRWLYKLAVSLLAVAGMMTAAIPRASAATGAGGLTILYASLQNQAHQCNVIADDGTDQAVVCSDIVTYEGATDYYAYGRAEMICQTSAQPHTTIPSGCGARSGGRGGGRHPAGTGSAPVPPSRWKS